MYIIVNQKHVFIKPMARHNILVYLEKVKCNRYENINSFIPWNRAEIIKYFSNWMVLRDSFERGYVGRKGDGYFLNFEKKKRNYENDEGCKQGNDG